MNYDHIVSIIPLLCHLFLTCTTICIKYSENIFFLLNITCSAWKFFIIYGRDAFAGVGNSKEQLKKLISITIVITLTMRVLRSGESMIFLLLLLRDIGINKLQLGQVIV